MQGAFGVVLEAHIANAIHHRSKLAMDYVLKDLVATALASVGHDLDERFDLGDPSDDATNGDKFPNVSTLDLSHSQRLQVVGGKGLEVEVAI